VQRHHDRQRPVLLHQGAGQRSDHLNLPQVIAANERRGLKAAYLKAVEIHNRIMAAFEEESAVLSATSPLVERYAQGLSDWVAGNHEWHATNTHRYHLPNYW
jgi:2-methylisoborneol synthase